MNQISRRNKISLSDRQAQLQALLAERLKSESAATQQRVYQWLSNNQYFLDNELFDFYFCVAQNIAAVEELGRSDGRIVQAKEEIQQSAQLLEDRLNAIGDRHSSLEQKLDEAIASLATERQNINTISTGLVDATSSLIQEQKQVLLRTQAAKKIAINSVKLAYAIPIVTLLVWGTLAFFAGKLHEYNTADAVNNRVLASQALRVRKNCQQQYLANPKKMNSSGDGIVRNCPGFEYVIPAGQQKVAE
ncbi:MAG: hypothetical protein CLLPBCKN_004359 [Chroococcidiopsis cubana SAG 39.79]|uniref:Uncharacterized protein n=1 Tax=Chroococcidiopsis cubana SAG 39.79 TaxID=388085 RepID=A0AB37ULQ6_9CYAN|nr:hypothetical protein [Chroococcidiopsis cubana]MDZ4874963.1 hypothetical protein [Chroococcidiopsis cubana SAG 39.79]RUT12334.1 hypothetical protein DSM107010_23440 [Chroococcidiopsis cubana SAG 39.79]